MPDQLCVGQKSNSPIVTPSPSDEYIFLESLSEKDKPWDKHRRNADIIEGYYRQGGLEKYANRIRFCSQVLDFKLIPHKDGQSRKLKLSNAQFCRVRHCPVCQWRRSLRWKAKAYEALPRVIIDYPDYRWLFVTLTLKNCNLVDLRATLDNVNYAFRKLTQLKDFPGVGWIKSVEVTRGRDGQTAHPHLHCLIMVPPSYFQGGYLSKKDWIDLWQNSLCVDYRPVLDVRAVKPESSPVGLIAEILKYQCKESDLVASKDWFLEYVKQMHKTRGVSVGGVLRGYFKDLEKEPEDLIGSDGEGSEADKCLQFRWNPRIKKYFLISEYPCDTRTVYHSKYYDTG
jgi:plasmid rolling circle replication initiator protein Rep